MLAYDMLDILEKLALDPNDFVYVRNEKILLSKEPPNRFISGIRPKEISGIIYGALDPESLIVRYKNRVLKKGKDYLFDPIWGRLGIAPKAEIPSNEFVTIDYRYSLRRIDSIIQKSSGKKEIRKGKSHISVSEPPGLKDGEKRLANLFLDYFCDCRNPDVFPIQETVELAKTMTTLGRIPRTLSKIRSSEPVRIICWGDSVTEGGEASDIKKTAYVPLFEKLLKDKFPKADIRVDKIAIGGSNSRQWLYPEKYRSHRPEKQHLLCWERIVEAGPDLVTVEFVNDADKGDLIFDEVYADILNRVKAMKAELILIAPHFTYFPEEKDKYLDILRSEEKRRYVYNLIDFAQKNNLAIADVSSRWAHLWKEGIPYPTLLQNNLNHPEDRGHRIFAEELIKCFS